MNLKAIIKWTLEHPARIGVVAGWFQQGCGILVAFLLIPIVTRTLTPAEGGIWFTFYGLISLIALMDLGFGFAISRQAAFTLGAREGSIAHGDFLQLDQGWSGVHQLFTLTRSLYRWLSLGSVLIAVLLFEFLIHYGFLISEDPSSARWCWYWMALASVLLILSAGQSSFINGLGAVYQTRILSGLYQLAAGIGASIAALTGLGLPGMGASFAVSSFLYWICINIARRKATKPMQNIKISRVSKGSRVMLAKAAIPVGVVNLFGSLVYTIQAPMLGILLGPEKVVPFYLGQKIALSCSMIVMQTALPHLPFFTREMGSRNWKEARTVMNSVVLRTAVLSVLSAAVFYTLSPLAASVVLGEVRYLDKATLLIMAVDFAMVIATNIVAQFVLAAGSNPFVAPTIAAGILNMLFVVVLVPKIGIIALPLSSLAANIMTSHYFNLLYGTRLYRRLKVLASGDRSSDH